MNNGTTDRLATSPSFAGDCTCSSPLASIAVLIPAFNPDHRLVELVRQLSTQKCSYIVVIDDGSEQTHSLVFESLREFNVTVLCHAVNLGKGRALKTGFNWLLCNHPDILGVVTADADGQHAAQDIERVARELGQAPGTGVVLGVRAFDSEVPLRSRIGNIVTRRVMGLLYGARLTDTQTGLRGIPLSLLPPMLTLGGERYEYEVGMLVHLLTLGIPIRQVEIQTIYIDGNRSSHFNPLLDSMRIYFVLMRFFSSSFLTGLIDFVFFALTLQLGADALAALITGRVCAVAFNYTVNRRFVFKDSQSLRGSLPPYLLTVVLLLTVSYLLIIEITRYTSLSPLTAKVVAESLLFFVSFALQRVYVFGRRVRGGGDE